MEVRSVQHCRKVTHGTIITEHIVDFLSLWLDTRYMHTTLNNLVCTMKPGALFNILHKLFYFTSFIFGIV